MATDLIGQKNKKGQTYTEPYELLFKAPRNEKAYMSGTEAAKEAIKRASCDFSVAYPITPQSETSALVGELWVEGYVGDYLRGENEFSVMGIIAGGAMGGGRTFTTTAGPGTMRAFENWPLWAGARLPVVCLFTCRGINSPLTIQPDNVEMNFMLDTGVLMLHAETGQEVFDWILASYVVAEQPDVHLPIGVFIDGFFVTHTRDIVAMTPSDMCLPPYDPYRSPVCVMDMESPPARMMRDPFVMKSNYLSYMTHASWQQEVWAASYRAKKHLIKYIGPLIETQNPEAEILFVASGTAVSQSREAMRILADEGIQTGLVKIKSIRPWPAEEIREATDKAKLLVIPEFNARGWLAREVKATIDRNHRVLGAPRVFGGMSMPPELIAETVQKAIKARQEVLA